MSSSFKSLLPKKHRSGARTLITLDGAVLVDKKGRHRDLSGFERYYSSMCPKIAAAGLLFAAATNEILMRKFGVPELTGLAVATGVGIFFASEDVKYFSRYDDALAIDTSVYSQKNPELNSIAQDIYNDVTKPFVSSLIWTCVGAVGLYYIDLNLIPSMTIPDFVTSSQKFGFEIFSRTMETFYTATAVSISLTMGLVGYAHSKLASQEWNVTTTMPEVSEEQEEPVATRDMPHVTPRTSLATPVL